MSFFQNYRIEFYYKVYGFICTYIQESNEFNKWLELNQTKAPWNPTLKNLNLAHPGHFKKRICIKRYNMYGFHVTHTAAIPLKIDSKQEVDFQIH